ncbi:unnamed protein product [Rhizophagus irregularis]|nr:unnamed protein product [Rhizophagus irregularis]
MICQDGDLGRGRSKKSLDIVVNETINGGTSDGKCKRSIISNSDSSDDEKNQKEKSTLSQLPSLEQNDTGLFHLSLTAPILQKNTLISHSTSVYIPKSLFSSTQSDLKNTIKINSSTLHSDDDNGNQTDDSTVSSQDSANENESTLLHANTSIYFIIFT